MTVKLNTIWIIVILIICVACSQATAEPSAPTPEPSAPTPTPTPPTPTPEPPTPTPVPPTPTPEPDLLSLVETYLAAHNRHNLEDSMALFAADAVLEIGSARMKGQEQIQAFHEHQGKLNAELQHENCSVEENIVTCQTVLSSDWERTAGIGELQFTPWVYTFAEGSIQQVSATPDPEMEQLLGRILEDFKPWAAEIHQSELAQLFSSDGQIIYGSENAALLVSLVEEWRAAVEPTLATALVDVWTVEGGGIYMQFNPDGTWRVSADVDGATDVSSGMGWISGEWWLAGPMLQIKDVKSKVWDDSCSRSQIGNYTVDVIPETSLDFSVIQDACGDRQYDLSSRHWVAYSP